MQEELDEFDKLPNDVLANILSRLNNDDAKFLTQTLGLVNKRIASLISTNITSVSTTIPNPKFITYSNESIDYSVSVNYLITTSSSSSSWKTAKQLWESRREIPPCDFFARKARQKLQRFRGLQNVKIEYPNFDDHTLGGIVFCPLKWKVEYSGGDSKNGMIKSCALLGVDTILAKPACLIDNGIDLQRRLDWLAYCFRFGLRFHPMAVQMARDHQYLRDISITTNCRQRVWIHAGEEEIIKMRQQEDDDDDDDDKTCCMHMKVKVWHVPVMDLPIGLRVSGATFVVATSCDDDDDDGDDEIKDAARRFWGYNGVQKDGMMQIIDMVEAGMTKLVDKKCTMEMDTIWHWTAH